MKRCKHETDTPPPPTSRLSPPAPSFSPYTSPFPQGKRFTQTFFLSSAAYSQTYFPKFFKIFKNLLLVSLNHQSYIAEPFLFFPLIHVSFFIVLSFWHFPFLLLFLLLLLFFRFLEFPFFFYSSILQFAIHYNIIIAIWFIYYI